MLGLQALLFLQNNKDGGQPLAIFNSLDKSTEFFGDCDIQNHYNNTELDSLKQILTSVTITTKLKYIQF